MAPPTTDLRIYTNLALFDREKLLGAAKHTWHSFRSYEEKSKISTLQLFTEYPVFEIPIVTQNKYQQSVPK